MKDADSSEPGYFVPEEAWEEMNMTVEAMSAITTMTDGPPRELKMSNQRLVALMGMFRKQFVAMRNSARFVS